MKKLITLSLIALFAVGNLMALDVDYSGTMRVRGKITENTGFDKDASTASWKSQRLRLVLTGEAENGVKFVTRYRLIDGDGSKTSETYSNPQTATGDDVIGKGEFNMDRAFMVVPDAFLGFSITAGLMPFYAKNGLVIDANRPGYYFGKSIDDISIGFGGFTQTVGTSTSDDTHALLAQLSMNNVGSGTLGLDVIAQTNVNKDANHDNANLIWISPWYDFVAGDFSVNVNPIILTGSYDLKDGVTESSTVKKIDGSVFALAIKPSYSLAATGTSFGGDILYVSGTDKPAEELTWSNLGSFYCSGLEYFGAGNEIDNYGDIGNAVSSLGQLSIAVNANHPLTSALTLHAAAGYVMTAEDVEYTKDGKSEKDNVLGTEIDLGLRWAVKDNVTWKFTGSLVMPGDATVQGTKKDENITILSSYLEYAF